MKVLLTGANGLVGSHVLDSLRARDVTTTVLLRPTSDRRFIKPHLAHVKVCLGSIQDRESLLQAMADATHVIHCAGCTKALRIREFYEVNQLGTRDIVAGVNALGGQIQRLVHISSLAAAGPAAPGDPARESAVPKPVSEYGRSKLAGEQEVRDGCRSDFVILRPPGVYGPRDREFLRLFRAVKAHVRPSFGSGRGALSLVFVKDLAEAVVACLNHPAASRKTYFVASSEVVATRQVAAEIAARMGSWTLPLPVPTAVLWLACAAQEVLSRVSGKANVLSRQKYPELKAPDWVCDPSRLREETGVVCPTTLARGIAETLAWYRAEAWL